VFCYFVSFVIKVLVLDFCGILYLVFGRMVGVVLLNLCGSGCCGCVGYFVVFVLDLIVFVFVIVMMFYSFEILLL